MTDPARRRSVPEGLLLVTAALCGFVVVVLGLVWATGRPASNEAAAESTAESAGGAATNTTPQPEPPAAEPPAAEPPAPEPPVEEPEASDPPAPFESDVELSDCPVGSAPESDAVICALVHFVEDARGRPFQRYPVVELVENDAFDQRVLADFDENAAELEITGDVLRSLEIIDADDDLVSLFRASLEVGVLGFYDPQTEELVVRGDQLDLFVQSVIVHELVHAHDDQWLEIDLSANDEADDESDFGYLAIVEGNATRIEVEWVDSLSSGDQTQLRLLENSALSASDIEILRSLPSFLLETRAAPYINGPLLVEAIAAAGGEEAIDEAFENPPRSSEQVLDPDAFFDGDEPLPTPPVEFDGVEIDSGVFGELGLRSWLGRSAAEGWGGDQYVTYERDDAVCTSLSIVMDTVGDLGELESAANDWASGGSDQTVERSVERSGDGLSITGCVSR